MGNTDIVNRQEILGGEARTYSFDRVLRGYDPRQVDDFLNSLVKSNKSASEIFDSRFNDLQNDNSMLTYELEQTKQEVKRLTNMLNAAQDENEKLAVKAAKQAVVVSAPDNSAQIKELEERVSRLTNKNSQMAMDKKKLEDENRDLKRDIAHLTKKVDKNRSKINDLSEKVETGISEEDNNKFYEIVQIYENAIDKAEDLIFRLQTELSLAHSKAEDAGSKKANEEKKEK